MPTTTILIASLSFVCLVFLSLKINVNTSEERVRDPTVILETFLDSKWGLADIFFRVMIMYLTFPFQFYIGKEFFFILYDEIKKRGISKKIDGIKSHTTQRNVFTRDMLHKVDSETYELVRQPYMKYTPK